MSQLLPDGDGADHPAPSVARGRARETMSLAQARRVVIAAQGLAKNRPEPGEQTAPSAVGMAALQRMIDRLGLLQIDSVNVLARAHLLPVMARLGPYDTDLLARAANKAPRRLIETWAHEASYVPPEVYRAFDWWRVQQWEHRHIAPFIAEHRELLDRVKGTLSDSGALTGRQVEAELGHTGAGGGWWNRSAAKHALEVLFRVGELGSAGRTNAFERRYDLAERVVPAGAIPAQDEAIRELVLRSARALGIGTLASLGDYYRLAPTLVAPVLEDLVAEGELIAVTVPGWGEAYLHPGARLPRSVSGRALLAPFDPLVFERPRLLALFGMHYRIGIYTPEAQRTHGYYVLPFLLGEAMVARVDLKADRAAGTLVVKHAHLEPEFRDPQTRRRTAWPSSAQVAHELVAEVGLMREWLGLESITVDEQARGDLIALTVKELTP